LKRRSGLGRSALLGVIVVVLLIVVAGVFALTLSGGKTTTTSTSSSSSTTSSTSKTTTSAASTCSLAPSSTVQICSSGTATAYNVSQPIGAVYDVANGDLYVTNNFTNTVSVFSVATDQLVAQLPTGIAPAQAAYDPVNGYVYVTNNESFTVTAIDGATNKVVATIQTGGLNPDGIAFDPANNCLYVAEHGNGVGGDLISVINATSNTYVRGIGAIYSPTAVAYDPDNGNVYITTGGSSVMVIDTANNTMTSQIDVGHEPRGIAFDPANGDLYVANTLSGTISVINGSDDAIITTIDVSTSVVSVPYLVAYDPANGYIMASNDYSSGVNVINGTTNTLVQTVATGFSSEPAALAFDSANGNMYVPAHATDAVVAISAGLASTYFIHPPSNTGIVASTTSSAPNLGD